MNESMYRFLVVVLLCPVWLPNLVLSTPLRWEGQVSAWGTVNDTDSTNAQIAARYINGISILSNPGNSLSADAYIAANTYLENRFNYNDQSLNSKDVTEVKLHRCYTRLTMTNVELRIGLQRLNFGSAVLLRPLKWFDSLDPRDAMQFSEGVYSALLRVFFNNNTNVWLWGLYGNDEVKGWELLPTKENQFELGCRIQYPVYKGELAFTYHRRKADLSSLLKLGIPITTDMSIEQRYAIDMRWDIEIGFWSEIVIVDRNNEFPLNRWQRFINLGADYTIEIGNGLGVNGEYFEIGEPAEPFGSSNPTQFIAGSLDYSLGIADAIKGVFFHDLEEKESYTFLTWIHKLDNWQFSINVFWNPPASNLNYDSESILTGKGIQATVNFNH